MSNIKYGIGLFLVIWFFSFVVSIYKKAKKNGGNKKYNGNKK